MRTPGSLVTRGWADVEAPRSLPHRVRLQLPGHHPWGLRGLGELPVRGGHRAVPVPAQRGGADLRPLCPPHVEARQRRWLWAVRLRPRTLPRACLQWGEGSAGHAPTAWPSLRRGAGLLLRWSHLLLGFVLAVHGAVPVHAGLWRPNLPGVPGALLGWPGRGVPRWVQPRRLLHRLLLEMAWWLVARLAIIPQCAGTPPPGAAPPVFPASAPMSLGSEGGRHVGVCPPGFWCLQGWEAQQEPDLALAGPLFGNKPLCVETNSPLTIKLQCSQVSWCGKKTHHKSLGLRIGPETGFLCLSIVGGGRPLSPLVSC